MVLSYIAQIVNKETEYHYIPVIGICLVILGAIIITFERETEIENKPDKAIYARLQQGEDIFENESKKGRITLDPIQYFEKTIVL